MKAKLVREIRAAIPGLSFRQTIKVGAAFCGIVLGAEAQGASVSLQWNPNPEPDVIGYKILLGTAGGAPATVVDAGNATNVTVGGLTEGVTYDFYASAYNSAGLESDLSTPVTHTVSTSTSYLAVSWERSFSPAATRYTVLYSPTNQTTFSEQNAGTNLNATLSNIVRGTTYYVTVEAYDANNSLVTEYEVKTHSIPTSGSIGSVHLFPIDQPPSVTLTSPADGSNYSEPATIQLSASASDDDAVQFVDLFAGTNLLARVNVAPYSFSWTNVPAGEYEVYAVAVDTLNQFTRSESALISVDEASSEAPPLAPSNFNARYNRSTGKVRLTWTDMSDNEESFVIERSLNGVNFGVIQTVAPDTQRFFDSTVQLGNRYYYRVRAFNAAGSNASSVDSVRVR
jgi:hypothetical protein